MNQGDPNSNNPPQASASETHSATNDESPQAPWQTLNRLQRRVAGVLVEKAKTTPDAYPLSLNALVNGCNQKSNRSPLMNLSTEDVQQAVDELREMGAVAEVQSGGRVAKYRHYLYDWLGVSKVEMAVMAELLLRGEQTLGELRARAARMEAIADLGELKPIVRGLIDRGLIISLTPEGRGQIVTHALYQDQELEKLKSKLPLPGTASSSSSTEQPVSNRQATQMPAAEPPALQEIEALREEVADLRELVERLSDRLDRLES